MPRKSLSKRKDNDDDYQNSNDDDEGVSNSIPVGLVAVKTEIVENEDDGSNGETFDFGGGQTETRVARCSRRPKRKAAVKAGVQIKEEPGDHLASDSDGGGGVIDGEGNSDYLMDGDEEEKVKKKRSSGSKPWNRKKVSEMDEEEREVMKAKWREEARQRRAKKRESMGVASGKRASGGEVKEKKGGNNLNKRESQGGGQKKGQSPYKKKTVAEMDEEERERMKEKWREEARQRRARKREQMTEEEKKEEIRKQNEQRKLLRWKKLEAMGKEVRKNTKREAGEKVKRKPLTEEEKEKKREWRRKWRESMSEEEKEKRRARWRERRKELRAEMTVEERRMKDYLDRQARLARMTKEEREQKKEEAKRRRLEKRGGLEGHKEYQRKWREGMTEDRKERFRRQLRESYYRKMERIKKDPQKLQEWRDKCKEEYQRKVMKCLALGVPVRRSRKGMKAGAGAKPLERGTEEWRKQLEFSRMWRKKGEIKRRLEIQRMLEEGRSMEEICQKVDPYGGDEEKRKRRLIRQRLNKQKLTLRRQLEGMGVGDEEIKRRLEEVEMTFQPTFHFRPFKLSSKSLEPVGPEEMKILEEEEKRQRMGRWRVTAKVEMPPLTPQDTSPQRSPYISSPQSVPSRLHPPQQSHNRPPQSHHQQQYVTLPHQQSSAAQQPTYSLEHFLHGMGVNFSTSQNPHSSQPGPSAHYPATSTSTHHNHHHQSPPTSQPAYPNHYQSSYSSSQHEYQQSNYTNSPPPASPLGGDDHHDDNHDNYNDSHEHHHHAPSSQFLFNTPPLPAPPQPPQSQRMPSKLKSSTTTTPGGRLKKPKRSLPSRKGTAGPPSGPRGPKKNRKVIIRDVICEECGNAYNKQYISEHKTRFHNPNFVNGKCMVCGESFTNAKLWYSHFLKLHINKDRSNDPRKRRAADPNVTGLFCDDCGAGFATRTGLSKHKYYTHGDGTKKENYLRCPICPEEKLFKSVPSYNNHMRCQHPERTDEMRRECFRCGQFFRWEEALSEHVKREHPESYWPCKWCKACRFSKYGLNFHLRKCTRGGRREVIPEGENLLEMDLECEFCGKGMKMTSMTRHYRDVHRVVERETFCCTEGGCRGKGGTGEFKRRDYWVVHLEERHGKKWEELREWVGRCNVVEREGLVVENEEGKKRRPEGGWNRKGVKREKKGEVDGGGKRKRRNVVVIAEEDVKQEMGGEQEEDGFVRVE